MTKTLKKIRLWTLIIVGIELIGLGVLCCFWFLNLFNIQGIINGGEIVAGAIGLICLDVLFYWFSLISIGKVRQKVDLETATLVGGDIQEAYIFGQIGLIVADDNNVVMWTNSLFKDRQIDLIDVSIPTWQPSLMDLVNGPVNKVIKIEIKARIYEVKYVSEPRLFILRDTTEYENIVSYSKEQAPCIGVVMIDNYNELAGDSEDSNDTVTKVRGAITEYFRDKGALLRRVRADTYFVVSNWTSLEKMEKDGFSVLEKARSCESGTDAPLTLSIGFAHDFPDVMKLNEMASNAIDIALSRGGDQCVVSKYGSELRFFGGKSAATETTSRVKVRSVADSVISLIKSSSNVFIMGHTEMDMDSLGAALGIKAICDYCHKDEARIVYLPKLAEKKTRIAFQQVFAKDVFDSLTAEPDEALSAMDEGSLLIVVDISRPSLVLSKKVLEKASKVVVIDHHRRAEEFIERPVLAYVEPSASSASELVTEMIRYATANPRIEVKPQFATLMLSGIFLDTNYYKSKATGMRTFEASEVLKDYGADNSLADDYLKDEFEEYTLITKIISTMQTPHYGIVYCVSDEKDIIERSTLAKVANKVMQLKGINACFVIGKTEEKVIRLSARSDGTINVQLLCEKMGGGGHYQGAAAVFMGQPISKVETTLCDTLDEYLDAARSSLNQEGEK